MDEVRELLIDRVRELKKIQQDTSSIRDKHELQVLIDLSVKIYHRIFNKNMQ